MQSISNGVLFELKRTFLAANRTQDTTTMSAILALVIKFLPYLTQAAQSTPEIISFIAALHDIFTRTKIWTPEQKAEFDAQTEALRSDPAWQVID